MASFSLGDRDFLFLWTFGGGDLRLKCGIDDIIIGGGRRRVVRLSLKLGGCGDWIGAMVDVLHTVLWRKTIE